MTIDEQINFCEKKIKDTISGADKLALINIKTSLKELKELQMLINIICGGNDNDKK